MITKEKLIKEFKNRNINAILIINNFTLTFFVENEETRKSVNDLMLGSYANTFFHYIVISNIYCEGLAILPVYNLNASFSNADGEVNEISFNLNKSKSQDILQPTNDVRLIVNGVDIFISQWKLEPICPLSIFSHSAINGYKFSCRINDMSELRLIQEENSVIELVVLDECFVLREFAFASDEPIFSGKFLRKKVLEEIYGLKNN